MSVLESIRNRAGLFVVLFVGFALLAFILQGALESGFSFFRGNEANLLGTINNKKIENSDFANKVNAIETRLVKQNKGQSLPPEAHDQIMNQVWVKYVDNLMYEPEYKAIGITVTAAEMADMLWGRNINPQIINIPLFRDSTTGQFSPQIVQQFVESLDENEDEEAPTQGVTYADWVDFEDQLLVNRKREKYNNLIAKGFYVPAAEAKRNFEMQNKNATVKYVAKRYDAVPDSTIKVSEEDIKKAYEDNKFRFRQNKTQRKVDLVVFEVTPSNADVEAAKKSADDIAANLKTATNDTAFAQANAENVNSPVFENLIKGKKPTPYDTALYAAAPGTVLGPFLENGGYKIIKVIKRNPDSVQVKARHILFATEKMPLDQAKVKADSVLKAIRGGADFATMARMYGSDGTAQSGGDLGYFGKGRMVKSFEDAAFTNPVGVPALVESQFGVHIIEVQQREEPLLVMNIERRITTSSKTNEEIYNKAAEFAAGNTTAEAFDKGAKAKNYQVRSYPVNQGDKTVGGIPNSNELARWAQDGAKKGEVSKAFQFDNLYVVACLKEVREKGIPAFEDVRTESEYLAKQAAKGAKFATELNGALTGSTTIDQVATKAKATVENTSVTYNAVYIPGIGRENALIGNIVTMKAGQMSKVITGINGVYVAYVESVNDLQPAANYNAKTIQQQLVNNLRQRASTDVNNVLEDKADIKDYRYRFY